MATASWRVRSGHRLRDVQLRLRLSVSAGPDGRDADQGVLHVRDGLPDRARHLRHRRPGWPRLHRARLHARRDGHGQLVCRHRRRRARDAGAADGDHRDRERAGGGPMAAISGLVGKFLGVAAGAASSSSATACGGRSRRRRFVDMSAEGAKGINPGATEPLMLENTGHPAADRFALARASKSHVHALGLEWDDVSGTNNGRYAPFSWASA